MHRANSAAVTSKLGQAGGGELRRNYLRVLHIPLYDTISSNKPPVYRTGHSGFIVRFLPYILALTIYSPTLLPADSSSSGLKKCNFWFVS